MKFNRAEPKISYLCYPTFDREAHPALAWSMRVAMGWCDVKSRDFRESANPPVLHRKEAFLPEDDPRHEKFRKLTVREEKLGLLDDTARIGTRNRVGTRCWQTMGFDSVGTAWSGSPSREHASPSGFGRS